jgi:broad specificity phosphatase PhoE
MRLYFVRHGQSEANVLREFSNSGVKHPLTSLGVEQAGWLAQSLAGQQFAQIYSSPVLRAEQTAEILAQTLHAPVEVTESLREWSVGVLEGTRDESGWALHQAVQEDWFLHGRLGSKISGGESYLEIRSRFVPFIEDLLQAGQGRAEQVLLVGHGGLYIAMLPEIFSNLDRLAILNPPYFPNAAYVLAETRPGGLFCLEWCGQPLTA